MFNFRKLAYSTLTTRTIDNLKSTNEKINKKIKGTIFEKWVAFWKGVTKDYTEVYKSVRQDMKEKPVKATIYFTGLGALSLCAKLNPDLQSFRAKITESGNDLALVSVDLTNPESVAHLKFIEQCFNKNLVRFINLGILSIVWVDKYDKDCGLYESNCSYLKVPFWDITQRIVDVGFLNVWWITSRKMLDYDINY